MPVVRIDLKKNSAPALAKTVGKVVYESLRCAINAPDQDNFQVRGCKNSV